MPSNLKSLSAILRSKSPALLKETGGNRNPVSGQPGTELPSSVKVPPGRLNLSEPVRMFHSQELRPDEFHRKGPRLKTSLALSESKVITPDELTVPETVA